MRQQSTTGNSITSTTTTWGSIYSIRKTKAKKKKRKCASVSVLVMNDANKVYAFQCCYSVVKHAMPVICCCCFYCCNIVHIYGRSVPQMPLSICCGIANTHTHTGCCCCCCCTAVISSRQLCISFNRLFIYLISFCLRLIRQRSL